MLHRRSDLASYFNDGKSRYTDQRDVNSGSSVRLGMYSCKMHIWFWALIASLYFIEVTSLPIPQWRSLDENHGIKDRSFLQRIPAPGDFTARFLARGNDQSDNELVDYVQNALGHLKISAPADSGDGLAQSKHSSGTFTWPWPTRLIPVRRQTTCGNNSQCGNGAGSSGPGDGVGNNVTTGAGGSSTTNRNIALGVGLGVGLPGAIVAMATIINYFRKKDRKAKEHSLKSSPNGSNRNEPNTTQPSTSFRPGFAELHQDQSQRRDQEAVEMGTFRR